MTTVAFHQRAFEDFTNLKHDLSGCWSRRINQEHRLVYSVDQDTVVIVSCKYHY